MGDKSVPHFHEDEEGVDGCLCNVEFDESEVVADADLPPVAGGVHTDLEKFDNEDAIDGCDLDLDPNDLTTDQELPIAVGGVFKMQPSEDA